MQVWCALELLDTSDNIALEAARAYYEVLRFRKLVALAEDNYVQHHAVLAQIQIRVKAGIGRRVGQALAESNLLTETDNLYDVTARFQRITGEVPAKEMEDFTKFPCTIPITATDAIIQAQARHPALRATIENCGQRIIPLMHAECLTTHVSICA